MPAQGSSLRIDRNQKTLRELTLEKMRNAIIGQYFQPGQRLVERTLCDELGVSRTIVREVLRHLETEGLVETPQGQGPMVATIDLETTRQIYEIRALLEGHAAASCARLADEQAIVRMAAALMLIEASFAQNDHVGVLAETTRFYEVMFSAGREAVAWSIVQSLNARINRLRAITITSRERSSSGPAEMKQVLEAIRQRQPEAAQRAAEAHVRQAAARALEALHQEQS
ncbi:GntR family transcriptional regulator (plasmid) [Aquabacterium olei]|uniref:GntR family transcriptional regulator n=2 Tax=Aquabacterium olei TaxID=1296669 RepID=A0A2U8FWZ9_9BURK|nr:GntR family transcriptional regulator [Aquabacterium olei]